MFQNNSGIQVIKGHRAILEQVIIDSKSFARERNEKDKKI